MTGKQRDRSAEILAEQGVTKKDIAQVERAKRLVDESTPDSHLRAHRSAGA